MSFLIRNATVLTVDSSDRVIDDGAVFIEEGRIVAVGPADEVVAAHPAPRRVMDGSRPGRPARLRQQPQPRRPYLLPRARRGPRTRLRHRPVLPRWRRSRPATSAGRSAPLTYAELLKSGVTTTFEMEEEADVFAPFVETLGVRSVMGVSTCDADVDAMAKDEYRYDGALRETQLRQAVEFAEEWHGRADGRIQAAMTPNMTISSSPELLRASREAADRLGLRTSIHLGWGRVRGRGDPPPSREDSLRVRARRRDARRGHGVRTLLRHRRLGPGRPSPRRGRRSRTARS